MTTVKHPRIPNVAVDVPESEVAEWVAQGWEADEPAPAEPDKADAPKPSSPKRRRK